MGDNRPVGILDSGLGGLTAVNAMKRTMPEESFVYVGDTARVPYGEKDVDTIRGYSREMIGFLRKRGVKAVIVACGTISSNVMEDMWKEFDLPIIDVVRPGIDYCLNLCGSSSTRIGIIATEAAIKSGFFQRILGEKNPSADVEAMACPLLVPLIEAGLGNHTITEQVVKAYIYHWQENPLDALILGCTHYPLIAPVIQKTLGETVLIDISAAAMEAAKEYFSQNGLLAQKSPPDFSVYENSHQFYVSGDVEKFNDMAGQITGMKVESQKVFWE